MPLDGRAAPPWWGLNVLDFIYLRTTYNLRYFSTLCTYRTFIYSKQITDYCIMVTFTLFQTTLERAHSNNLITKNSNIKHSNHSNHSKVILLLCFGPSISDYCYSVIGNLAHEGIRRTDEFLLIPLTMASIRALASTVLTTNMRISILFDHITLLYIRLPRRQRIC